MQQLLFVALGAAGSLLLDLPGLAQLTNDVSTFNGEVAAACAFDLSDSTQMTLWPANYMTGYEDFELTTNVSSLRLSLSQISVDQQPATTRSAITSRVNLNRLVDNPGTVASTASNLTTEALALSTSNANSFRIGISVLTAGLSNGKYELPVGDYAYSITLSCLL